MKIRWFGHAAFEIDIKDKRIYLDPFSLPIDFKIADFILITHEHYDHCDLEDIKKIQSDKTLVIANEVTAKKIPGNLKIIKEWEKIFLDNIKIIAVPAYNTNKKFHPKGFGLGFIIETEGKKVYHAGDTDLIPEMKIFEKNFGKINLALLPVGGTYTMNFQEGIEAVKIIKPEIAVPMHYGKIVGSINNAKEFKKRVEELNLGIEVKIFKEGGEILEI